MKTQQRLRMAGLSAGVLLASDPALGQKGAGALMAKKPKVKPEFQADQGGTNGSGVVMANKQKDKPKYQVDQSVSNGSGGIGKPS